MAFFRKKNLFSRYWCVVFMSGVILAADAWSDPKDIFFHEMEGNYDSCSYDLIPGKSYFRNEYNSGGSPIQEEQYDVEYVAGNLPIIISVPHGGYSQPDEIKNNSDINYPDRETIQMANELFLKIHRLTAGYPHLIITRLYKRKLNMNRYYKDPECMADFGSDSRTRQAWDDFHFFIDEAKRASVEAYGFGFFVDLHGQSTDAHTQVGYGISKSSIVYGSEESVNERIRESSLVYVSEVSGTGSYDLLFGENGIGEILHEKEVAYGIPDNDSKVYPSYTHDTMLGSYKSGHYNLYRHAGMNAFDDYGRIYPLFSDTAIQEMVDEYYSDFYDALCYTENGVSKVSGTILELNGDVRDYHKEKMCWAIADAVVEYVEFQYNVDLNIPSDSITVLDEGFDDAAGISRWSGEWFQTAEEASCGNYSIKADADNQGDLTSPVLNCEDATEITVSFNYRKQNLGDDDLTLYFGNGEAYDEIPIRIEDQGANNGWIFYSVTTKDPRFFTGHFQVRFSTSSLRHYFFREEALFIDSVHIMKKTDGVTDESGSSDAEIILDENFEGNAWSSSWQCDWVKSEAQDAEYGFSAEADGSYYGKLETPDLSTDGATEISVSFRFKKDDIESDELSVYYFDGSSYQFISSPDSLGEDDAWIHYTDIITDPRYLNLSNFRIRFETGALYENSIGSYLNSNPFLSYLGIDLSASDEHVWIDDVQVMILK